MPWKLLLVDDSVTIRRVVELTFAGEDVNVVAVGDGREAMDRILAERPDIVLADVGPGEPDGYEVARFVKQHPELGHVPVVLLTGAFQPVDRVRAGACGCDGVLAKPFDLQSMVGVVRGLLDTPRASQPACGDPAPTAEAKTSAVPGPSDPVVSPPVAPPAPPDDPDDRDAEAVTLAEAATLIDWWARLLEEGGPESPQPAWGAAPVPMAAPSPLPATPAGLSLEDYFDLIDDLLARPHQPDPRLPPLPPFKSS